MIEKVKSFIRALNEQKSSPIQVVLACRALDADITCESKEIWACALSINYLWS